MPFVERGTLDVALATPRAIVVATDSRGTAGDGQYEDRCKKLFEVGRRRVVAIAGLLTAAIPEIPWLTAQVGPLLEYCIEHGAARELDDRDWDDPPDLPLLPRQREMRELNDPVWWSLLKGPIQTITNIATALYDQVELEKLHLRGIIAGFQSNGHAKLERRVLTAQEYQSSWNRRAIGFARVAKVKQVTSAEFIWDTAGVDSVARLVLEGSTAEVESLCARYPGIATFVDRRRNRTVDAITENEMIALARDLVDATAGATDYVGGPVQLAVMRPGQDVTITRPPALSREELMLHPEGSWHHGVVFTSDYPFPEGNGVFTFCEFRNNRTPITLDGNHFYGNAFEDALCVYRGGRLSFGRNSVRASTLLVGRGLAVTEYRPLARMFDRVLLEADGVSS